MRVPLLVIGVGNEYCGDDGAGLAVVRALQARQSASCVRFLECDGNCTALLDAWQTAERVILIDAVTSGARPGTIYCVDPLIQSLPAKWIFFSTHALGIAETVALAQTLGQLPPNLLIYGIEGEQFVADRRFSPAVKRAIEKVIYLVQRDLPDCHPQSERLCGGDEGELNSW